MQKSTLYIYISMNKQLKNGEPYIIQFGLYSLSLVILEQSSNDFSQCSQSPQL